MCTAVSKHFCTSVEFAGRESGKWKGEKIPNRILREGILTSERMESLNWAEEVFYRRLMSVVDDFGRYYARPALLRAACYPLLLTKVSDSDIEKWLTACVNAALVRVYPAQDGKRYLEMIDFRQQVRAVSSKFPASDSGCIAPATQVHSNSEASAHLGGGGDVSEVVFDKHQQQRAQVSETDFAMNADWQPSENITVICKLAGAPKPTAEDIGEFVSYWIGRPDMQRTQHQWEHSLAKSLKASASKAAPKKPAKAKHGTPDNLSFAERDRIAGMQRWEQMTNSKHPDLPDEFSRFKPDVSTVEAAAQLSIAQ